MRTLVLGGIRSGKSRWAEAAIVEDTDPDAPVSYLATGPVSDHEEDAEWAARIAAHRQRRPETWTTVENVDVAAELRRSPRATLVDDIGTWLTAAMDRRDVWRSGSVDADIHELIAAVDGFTAPLVLVSPEVGLTVVPETSAGRQFADLLGTLNQQLADVCDQAVLVVAGLPLWLKRIETL